MFPLSETDSPFAQSILNQSQDAVVYTTNVEESESNLLGVQNSCHHLSIVPSKTPIQELCLPPLCSLESIKVCSHCGKGVTLFTLTDKYPNLMEVRIETSCFESKQNGGSFQIANLPSLERVVIGNHSFVRFQEFSVTCMTSWRSSLASMSQSSSDPDWRNPKRNESEVTGFREVTLLRLSNLLQTCKAPSAAVASPWRWMLHFPRRVLSIESGASGNTSFRSDGLVSVLASHTRHIASASSTPTELLFSLPLSGGQLPWYDVA